MHHDVNQTKEIKGISDAVNAHLLGTSLQGTKAIEATLARRGAALTPDKKFDPISLTVRLWHKRDAQSRAQELLATGANRPIARAPLSLIQVVERLKDDLPTTTILKQRQAVAKLAASPLITDDHDRSLSGDRHRFYRPLGNGPFRIRRRLCAEFGKVNRGVPLQVALKEPGRDEARVKRVK